MLTTMLASTALALVSTQPANQPAPQGTQPEAPTQPRSEGVRDNRDAIVITGHVIEGLDLLANASVLEEPALQAAMEPQIGDVLVKLPGVSATSFSPGASRPVLRGFQGERVRVLNDGLGAIDVSNTSADHAVTIDPLTAERVEVLRGPAVLIYGSQAIGGAVNVIDRRIPRVAPEGGFHVDAIAGLRSADDGFHLGAAADAKVATDIVVHGDLSYNKSQDLSVGGYTFSDSLRAELRDIAAEEAEEGNLVEAEEFAELAELRGTLPNSGVEQTSGALGIGYVGDRVEFGVSANIFDTFYGVPLRPGTGHHHEGEEGEEEEGGEEEAEIVSIDLRQYRYDARAKIYMDGFFEALTIRAATADYEHTELEGEEVGTVYSSNGIEGRAELKQRDTADGWHGASGIQYYHRDFDAVGAEAFLAPNETSQLGLFTVQEYQPDRLGVEGALRVEFTDVESAPLSLARDFTTFSVAAGVNYELVDDTVVGLNLSRTERAPSAEELFSNGPHIATQAFERGDPDLDTETSLGGELYARHDGERFLGSATLWANKFSDFIYEADTGLEEDELPLFEYRQQDADYYGIELEADALVAQFDGWDVHAKAVADYIRAEFDDGTDVPRIPPMRVGGGVTVERGPLFAGVDVDLYAEQDRVASFETPTDGFALVGAKVGWRPFGEDQETLILLQANNIFDVEARRHASFTKDFVPLAGRDIRLSARFSF